MAQTRFLPFMHSLQNNQKLSGLCLLHSDEVLLSTWLIDACRQHWQAHQQLIRRLELKTTKDWQEVLTSLNSLSLFDDANALIITGNHKPDAQTLASLAVFAQEAQAGDNPNHLLWILPKQDKKSQASKAFQLFQEQGLVIDANIYHEQDRREILTYQANRLGLLLDNDAWQTLLSHTENDLLAAFENLWRLSFFYLSSPSQPTQINADTILQGLSQGGCFNVFDLSEALLNQNPQQCLKIIHHLEQTQGTPSLALWALQKDLGLIGGLMSGQDPQSLGIWRNKITTYQSCAQRINPEQLKHLFTLIYEADCAIKGISNQKPWRIIEEICLLACGILVHQTT